MLLLDAESFPFNDSTKKYFEEPYVPQYFTSTGCWGHCTFCVLKDAWEGRQIKEVVDDLEKILSQTNEKHIVFGDPNIGANTQRIREIGKVMKKYDATWHSNIRPDTLSQKMIDALQDSNCSSIEIGAECGNDVALELYINKGITTQQVLDAAERLSHTDISCMYSFLTNFPHETKEIQQDTINFIEKIHKIDPNSRTSIYSYMPLPGTEMYDEAIKTQGFVPPTKLEDWEDITMTNDPIYWITGLKYRKDNTKANFPGLQRLKIAPYEILAHALWKIRKFDKFPCASVAKTIKKRIQ